MSLLPLLWLYALIIRLWYGRELTCSAPYTWHIPILNHIYQLCILLLLFVDSLYLFSVLDMTIVLFIHFLLRERADLVEQAFRKGMILPIYSLVFLLTHYYVQWFGTCYILLLSAFLYWLYWWLYIEII